MKKKETKTPDAPKEVVARPRGSSRNQNVGHQFERDMCNVLREIGFEHVCTTRIESKARDAQKVDIMNKNEYKNGRLPYNIQCKNLVMGMKGRNFAYPDFKYPNILNAMPQDGPEINVIFHNMTEKQPSGKFKTVGQYAHVKLYDFVMMMKELKDLRSEVAMLKEGVLVP